MSICLCCGSGGWLVAIRSGREQASAKEEEVKAWEAAIRSDTHHSSRGSDKKPWPPPDVCLSVGCTRVREREERVGQDQAACQALKHHLE